MAAKFRLNLNQAALLYVPPNIEYGIKDACIVQVTVRSVGMLAGRSPSVDDCATFFCYADEISNVVQSVVLGHLSCPDVPANLILQGEKYLLRAARKEWSKGKEYRFKWGDQIIQSASEKWVFEVVPTM